MFDLDPEKILLLGIVALVVLGPNRLPEAARSLGRMVAHLRSVSASLQTEVRDALGEPGEELNAAMKTLRGTDVRGSVRRAVTSTIAGGVSPPPATPSARPDSPRPVADPGSITPPGPDDPSLN